MAVKQRVSQIQELIDQRGYLSVRDLSEYFHVSEMTIRRDLSLLENQGKIKRTFGGASGLDKRTREKDSGSTDLAGGRIVRSLTKRVDVLIATSLERRTDSLLLNSANKKTLPVIAESAPLENNITLVALDNFESAFALGQEAGLEAKKRWDGNAALLDLTYRMPNTQTRSEGFWQGLKKSCPDARLVLRIDAQSNEDSAFQVTKDALTVHPQINMIFAINDATAMGALKACRDLERSPESITVITFGLEGDPMRTALAENTYCRLGLAMFPEIVAPTCVEAAIQAFNHVKLPPQLVTPYEVLRNNQLNEIYEMTKEGWKIRWEVVDKRYRLPLDIHPNKARPGTTLPKQIGFIVPFSEHEWYHQLVRLMQEHASAYNIRLEFVDSEVEMQGEVESRRKAIALLASKQVQPKDVLIIDDGPIECYLAENLLKKADITVITNSVRVFDIIKRDAYISLISTGGILRRNGQVLVGPTAESSLRDLRADVLFLTVSGISKDFGLSHTDYSEVSIKQMMIRSAKQVILLADYTNFGQEAVAQVEALGSVDTVITDDSLPAEMRLELAKQGIKLLLATD